MAGAFNYNLATTKKGVAFQGPLAGLVYSASTAAPINPTPGDQWYDTNTGALLVYVNDGTSSQWVEIGNNGVANPVGTIIPFAGASSPSGFLLCDGTSVSSSNYLALHSVISNTYGGSAYTGAAGLSFNLPDYRGRTLIGAGTGSGLTARTLGGTVGTETHTLANGNIPSLTSSNAGSHSHTPSASGSVGNVGISTQNLAVSGGSQWGFTPGTITSTAPDHSHTVGNASPTAINHMPPAIGVNYLIKT